MDYDKYGKALNELDIAIQAMQIKYGVSPELKILWEARNIINRSVS